MRGVVPLIVLPLASTTAIASQLPAKPLSDYFGALGFPLSFIPHTPLMVDPTDHPDEIDDFCRSVGPPPGKFPWPGVVLVSDMSVDGPSTNGILLDLDHRGVCAIFTQSFAFLNGNDEGRFEIYAHEIGHMLNLTHADARDKFPTAMNQWDVRSSISNRIAIWRQATKQGSPLQRTLLSAFFGDGTRHPIGLPMSTNCCQWLASASPANVFPWGGGFKDSSDDGAEDTSFGLVDCRLILTSEGSVGQPVDLQVQILAASGLDEVEIPAAIDLRSGLIELYITSPHGVTRKYQTKSRTCGTSRQRLERGRVVRRNYTLIGDSNGVLFPTPGKYRIEAVLPTLGASSGSVEYAVSSAIGPFTSADFQHFLARGFPNLDAAGWRAVDEALNSRDITSKTKAFLKGKAAARGRQPFVPLDEFRREASLRVQEKDALLRVVRLRQTHFDGTDNLNRAIDNAEDILRKSDTSNPSIQYLEHIRQRALVDRNEKEKR